MTDTVGFIRDMPRDLFAAFRATFEEIADADLLLEIVDASSEEREEHVRTTDELLAKLDLDRLPRLRVYNKADRVTSADRACLNEEPSAMALSATEPGAAKLLLERIGFVLRRAAPALPLEVAPSPEGGP